MLTYCTDLELERIEKEHPDDIVIWIDSYIAGERDLIKFVEKSMDCPYDDNNWDGFEEAISDLYWVPEGKAVRLLHFSMPDLSEKELDTYIRILIRSDDFLTNLPDGVGLNRLFIYFHDSLRAEVENVQNTMKQYDTCLKYIKSVNTVADVEPQWFSVIPVFIDDGLLSGLYVRKTKCLRRWMTIFRTKHTVEYLARLIERNESRIAWVDILLYRFDGKDALYFVELVCLNKKPGVLNYHASVETDKYGKKKLY